MDNQNWVALRTEVIWRYCWPRMLKCKSVRLPKSHPWRETTCRCCFAERVAFARRCCSLTQQCVGARRFCKSNRLSLPNSEMQRGLQPLPPVPPGSRWPPFTLT